MKDLTKTLDWEVEEKEVFTADQKQINGYKAILRSDDQEALTVRKKSYTPLTNKDFIKRVEKIQEISGFELEGFNEFKNGARVLGFLKNDRGGDISIGGNKLKEYMVIGNAHDGSASFFIGTSTVLIRCSNAFSLISKMTKVRHTKNVQEKMQEAYDYFDYYLNKREKMLSMFYKFNKVEVNPEIREKMINFVMGVKKGTPEDEISTRKQNQIISLRENIEIETGDLGETLWGIFNGITRYTTHEITSKHETFGNVFGTPALLNERAYDFCEKAEQGLILEF